MVNEYCYGIIPCKKTGSSWEIFLVRHRRSDYWGFPKGHIDSGETPHQTAERELFEETNLKIVRYLSSQALEENYSFSRGEDLIIKRVIYFLAEVEGNPKAQAEDVLEGRWVRLENLYESLTFSEARALSNEISSLLNTRT